MACIYACRGYSFVAVMTFPSGTATVFARCLSAEMRARAGARRITQRALAQGAGFNSHNYLSIRWRDEAPLTADDLERICDYFEITPEQFVTAAVDNHLATVIAARDTALSAEQANGPVLRAARRTGRKPSGRRLDQDD